MSALMTGGDQPCASICPPATATAAALPATPPGTAPAEEKPLS